MMVGCTLQHHFVLGHELVKKPLKLVSRLVVRLCGLCTGTVWWSLRSKCGLWGSGYIIYSL